MPSKILNNVMGRTIFYNSRYKNENRAIEDVTMRVLIFPQLQ